MSLFDKITDAITNASSLPMSQVPAVIAQARPLIESDPDGAVKLLKFVVQTDPQNVEGWSLLALAHSNADRSLDAEQAYRKVQALQPDSADGYLGIGTELLTQEEPARAENYLMHGLLLSDEPSAVDLYNLALCLFQQERREEAIPFCKDSYHRSPDPDTAVLLADCFHEGLRYDDAAEYYGKCLDGDQENTHAAERLGHSLELAGRGQEAIVALNNAIAKGSEDAEVYASLSRCYEALGATDKAQEAAAKYYEFVKTPGDAPETSPTDG